GHRILNRLRNHARRFRLGAGKKSAACRLRLTTRSASNPRPEEIRGSAQSLPCPDGSRRILTRRDGLPHVLNVAVENDATDRKANVQKHVPPRRRCSFL